MEKINNAAKLIVVSLILVISALAQQQVADVRDIVRTAKQSVVFISVDDDINDGRGGIGSGFFIAPNRVITNYHVISGMHVGAVKLVSGQTYNIQGVIAYDVEADLAMLQIRIPSDVSVPALRVSGKLPEQGERVIAIGNPRGLDWTISDGIISALRQGDGFDSRIQMTVPISPGSSGGPVLNMRGEVIGVAVSGRTDAQNINFAVPGKMVLALQPHAPVSLAKLATDTAAQKAAAAKKFYDAGLSLADAGKCKEAIPQFSMAVRIKNDYLLAWAEIAQCQNRLGNYTEALKILDDVIKSDPRLPLPRYYAAQSLKKLNRLPEAIQMYRNLISLVPNFDRAYTELAYAYFDSKRYDDAVAVFRQAINRKPNDATNYNGMAVVSIILGKPKLAVEWLERAIKISPNYSTAHYNLGLSYYDLGKYKNAITAFKQSLRIDPKYEKAHYNLGLSYLKNGDKAGATAEYNVLRGLNSPLADQLLKVMYK